MAQNTTDDTKPPMDEGEISETLVCAVNKTVSCDEKEKEEATGTDKVESTSKETADIIKKEKAVANIDVLESKEQSNTRETNRIKSSEKENNREKEKCFENINRETKESFVEESCSATKFNDAGGDTLICEEEKRLNEILKVVHGDLDINYFQKSANDSGKKQQTVKAAAASENNATEESAKECTASTTIWNMEEKRNSRESSEKMQETSEVGIVGPPTAVSELINEEELGGDSADPKDHVVEWVENSVKADALTSVSVEEDDHIDEERKQYKKRNILDARRKKKKVNDALPKQIRRSQRIISNIIKKSIKCLNKMHAMESVGGNGRNVEAAENTPREDESPRTSPKVPQSQQNGAALPEETAASSSAVDCSRSTLVKTESPCDTKANVKNLSFANMPRQKAATARKTKSEVTVKKRKCSEGQASTNEFPTSKKLCSVDHREEDVSLLVACENNTPEEYAAKAKKLQQDIKTLDKLARTKETEWNRILSLRKMTEEAFLRIKRKMEVKNFMTCSSSLTQRLPLANLSLDPDWESSDGDTPSLKERSFEPKEDLPEEGSEDSSSIKKQKITRATSQRRRTPPKTNGENGRKNEVSSPEYRQIGEGRQGTILDVSEIIAKHRKTHPETVPRRGRRMRNSINVGLTAGGAMVEAGHNPDSRPSSTDSCKSNPNTTDCNNSMSFKDVLVQFAKLSQQQGEPVKTPQNYPDVTLHPVPPSPMPQSTAPQQTSSLLHGILTKAQSPRPTTFSPTLARLLTTPERERNSPAAATTAAVSMPQQNQHLLQAYQGSNLGTISELLSSSKARTEITITPVVNTSAQSHSNNVIHVEDVEEETTMINDRGDSKYSTGGKDCREERDNPPRCQGCHERAAQFVCAGCGNQWYCSRDCQIAAWDKHSEACSV